MSDLVPLPCPLRQMLFCRVTLGKSFLQFSAMKMAHAPPGHHSVIGRPSVNGLAYAEYVIYRGEQVNAKTNVWKVYFPKSCLGWTQEKNTWNTSCLMLADVLLYFSFRHTRSTSSPTRSLNRRAQPRLLQELNRSRSYFHNTRTHTHGLNARYFLLCVANA